MDTDTGKVLDDFWNNKIDVQTLTTKLNQTIQPLLDQAKVRRDLTGSYLPQGWKSPTYS
jgi:hypothetical protein